MKTLQLNDSGDLEFDGVNNLRMVDGVEEVRQRLRLTIKTNRDEWFLNKRFGYPWFDLLSGNEPETEYRKELIKVLNNDPAVDEVVEINLNRILKERKLEIEFVVIVDDERLRERVVI